MRATQAWPANPLAQLAQDAGLAVASGSTRTSSGSAAAVPLSAHDARQDGTTANAPLEAGVDAPASMPVAEQSAGIWSNSAIPGAAAPGMAISVEPSAAPVEAVLGPVQTLSGATSAAASAPALQPDQAWALDVISQATSLASKSAQPAGAFTATKGSPVSAQDGTHTRGSAVLSGLTSLAAPEEGQESAEEVRAVLRSEALSGLERVVAELPLTVTTPALARPLVLIMGLAGTMGDWCVPNPVPQVVIQEQSWCECCMLFTTQGVQMSNTKLSWCFAS